MFDSNLKRGDRQEPTNAAFQVYIWVANQMENESLPVGYYRSCGNSAWYKLITGQFNYGTLKEHCSARDQLSFQKWSYECILYKLLYGCSHFDIYNLSLLGGPAIRLVLVIFGTVNFIIMRRVQKKLKLEGDGGAPLLLHQTQIACDILPLLLMDIQINQVLEALYFAVIGNL